MDKKSKRRKKVSKLIFSFRNFYLFLHEFLTSHSLCSLSLSLSLSSSLIHSLSLPLSICISLPFLLLSLSLFLSSSLSQYLSLFHSHNFEAVIFHYEDKFKDGMIEKPNTKETECVCVCECVWERERDHLKSFDTVCQVMKHKHWKFEILFYFCLK